MKLVIQRVKQASVTIGNEIHSQIGHGLMVLVGIHNEDSKEIIDWYVNKLINMRIFNDEQGKMNVNIQDLDGSLLLVSQFTLLGNAIKGNRPSFIEAAAPDIAIPLYEYFISSCKKILGDSKIQTGIFGADMQVGLINDGPVTIIL